MLLIGHGCLVSSNAWTFCLKTCKSHSNECQPRKSSQLREQFQKVYHLRHHMWQRWDQCKFHGWPPFVLMSEECKRDYHPLTLSFWSLFYVSRYSILDPFTFGIFIIFHPDCFCLNFSVICVTALPTAKLPDLQASLHAVEHAIQGCTRKVLPC